MSTPSTIERSERLALADMAVVDADVHINDTPGELAPYCDMPWRLVARSAGTASIPLPAGAGLRPEHEARSADPRRPPNRSVNNAAEMRAD